MAITHTTAVRNLIADAVGGAFDGGTGRVAILTGAPVAAGSAQSGSVLATFTLPSDAFAAASGGAAALNAVSNVAASAGGTAGSFCIYRTGDTAISSAAGASDRRLTGSVATSGGDMAIDNATIVNGGTLSLAWSYAAPA